MAEQGPDAARTPPPGLLLTPSEWDELFAPDPDEEPVQRSPWPKRIVGLVLVLGMIGSGAALLSIITGADRIRSEESIANRAEEIIDASTWGFLSNGVVVEQIPGRHVAGYVENPANGVVFIDNRAWDPDALRETVVHELGHLLDHATRSQLAEARGGLPAEVWAECASVDEGGRSLDDPGATQRYRCTPDELARYREVVATLDVVCRPWGVEVCTSRADREAG